MDVIAKHKKPKVICIGWHKTGTSSMGSALLKLGYKVLGAREDMAYPLLKGDVETPINTAAEFEALQDMPWAALYKELDLAYPNSKFILTLRDEESWLNSAQMHFKNIDIPLHQWLYGNGVLEGNEQLYLKKYRTHHSEVINYFKGREQDLLIMDFSKGDGWKKLCHFLDKPIPKIKFPHENKGKHSLNKVEKFLRAIRKITPGPIQKFRVIILKKLGIHHNTDRFNNSKINKIEQNKYKRDDKKKSN